MELVLNSYGNNLGTRIIGQEIREKIAQNMNNNEITILNFENIEIISDACADEIFTKLITSYGVESFKQLTRFKSYNKNVGIIVLNKINYAINKIN